MAKNKYFSGFKNQQCPVTGAMSANSVKNLNNKIHISYNPSYQHYGLDTTAIVFNNRLFFILNGDFKLELSEAYSEYGLNGLLSSFLENIKKSNRFSEHLQVIGKEKDLFQLKDTFLEFFTESNLADLIKAVD